MTVIVASVAVHFVVVVTVRSPRSVRVVYLLVEYVHKFADVVVER